ncbi:MAG: hypothetical protein JWQ36_1543 [Enterovirga sp.]|nr:hypothetical protein [Enterovirga sp.]
MLQGEDMSDGVKAAMPGNGQAEEGQASAGERPRSFAEALDWMREMLGEMSAAETVALSGIIAAALLLCWRAAR